MRGFNDRPVELTERQKEQLDFSSRMHKLMSVISEYGTTEQMDEAIEALKAIAQRALGPTG